MNTDVRPSLVAKRGLIDEVNFQEFLPGLNTYRLIRGQSQDDVNMKARLQLAQWEERWQAKARAQKSRADHMTGKELALERTLELERRRDASVYLRQLALS